MNSIVTICAFPGLEEPASKVPTRMDGYWAERARATVEIRTTHASLPGLETRTVPFGTGSPVRLQLPTLRRTSIGTTVVAPAGFAR